MGPLAPLFARDDPPPADAGTKLLQLLKDPFQGQVSRRAASPPPS